MPAFFGGKRIAAALLVCVGGLALAPDPAGAFCDTPIRVLVARSREPVSLFVEGRLRRVAPVKSGVAVDGRYAGERWDSGPLQSARVGSLRLTGRLRAFRHERDLVVVNDAPLEVYVAGAIGGEMPTDWASDALRAQAVASRSYALHRHAESRRLPWDVEAGTRSQVFRGLDVAAAAKQAAEDTRCQILEHDGRPILAAFHSASGGRSASAAEVWGEPVAYLVSRDVSDEDDSPDTYWRAAISRSTLARALGAAGHRVGRIEAIEVVERSESGRVRWLRVDGTKGELRLTGRQLRTLLGESTLRSTLFELRPESEGFVFVGSGSGHGVGMSQWGARGLAERGVSYREILAGFFPGTTLRSGLDGRTTAWRAGSR